MRVLVVNHVSLDGVLQGPGRPDEDTRDGFRHGGWALEANNPAMMPAMGERMGKDFSWLFGRRSYDDMLTYWNHAGGPFKDGLNGTRKYVASSNPEAGPCSARAAGCSGLRMNRTGCGWSGPSPPLPGC